MKLKHIIPCVVAALAMITGCADEDSISRLDEVQLSSSYVALDVNSDTVYIDVTAKDNWAINADDVPEWLRVKPLTGGAGSSQITFSADSTLDGRSATLKLICGEATQFINVIQGTSTIAQASVKEVMAGPNDKTYQVKGTVTKITETATYGNFYMNDGTSDTDLYIYGTKYQGQTKQAALIKLGVEVGDEIIVSGPKSTYNGTVELVDVDVIQLNKSLIKVEDLTVGADTTNVLPIEGGDIVAHLMCKGNGISVEVPADAKSWLSIYSINGNNVTFHAAANAGGDRSTTLVFKTTDGKKDYTAECTIEQKGAIVECSVADFLAAPVGDTQYRLTGVIQNVTNTQFGNFYLVDYSGAAYVYGIGAKGDFEALGLKEGDIITIVGKRSDYKGTPQVGGAQLEKLQAVEKISLADFKALEDDATKSKYYMIEGVVTKPTEDNTKFDLETFGNFALTDGTTEVYIYGCTQGWAGPSKQFGTLGVKEGDRLTMLAYKTSYKGLIEGVGFYFSHVPAN